jgi:hypothetical protein
MCRCLWRGLCLSLIVAMEATEATEATEEEGVTLAGICCASCLRGCMIAWSKRANRGSSALVLVLQLVLTVAIRGRDELLRLPLSNALNSGLLVLAVLVVALALVPSCTGKGVESPCRTALAFAASTTCFLPVNYYQ